MSQVIDQLERSENYKRGYRSNLAGKEKQASFVFIPRYMKYVIPAINIALGAIVVIGISVALFA